MSTALPTSTTVTEATKIVATVEALTTVFTAPASCTQMQLSIMSSPGYNVWLNEPQPVPGTKYPNCYPSEFIDGYTSIVNASSSIAPMMSPLVAPDNWSTVKELDNGYIALCPSGFQLTPPKTTIDSNRPAYGGTCWSNFEAGKQYTLSGFDSAQYTGTVIQTFAITDQAFAHPIEGKKMTKTGASSTSTSSPAVSAPAINTTPALPASSDSDSPSQISGGAIAGAVVGSIAGLALILIAAFLLFRRRRRGGGPGAAAMAAGGHNAKEIDDSASRPIHPNMGIYEHYQQQQHQHQHHQPMEKDLPAPPAEEGGAVISPASATDANSPYASAAPPQYRNYAELPDHHYAELDGRQAPHGEMDGGWKGSELGSSEQARR